MSWWEEDRAATATEEPWWETDERPAEKEFNLAAENNRMLQAARHQIKRSSVPQIHAVLEQIRTGIESRAQRVGGSPGVLPEDNEADKLVRLGDAYSQAIAETDTPDKFLPPILRRGLRGVGVTVPETIVAGAIGGPAGAIAAAVSQEGNQAITAGRDVGLRGPELAGYVATEATAEAVPATVMQLVGLGGLETAVGRPAAQAAGRGLVDGLKRAGFQTLQELPEEIVTELGHSTAKAAFMVQPDALNPEQLAQTVADTTVQTLLTMGLVEAPQIAQSAINGPVQQPLAAHHVIQGTPSTIFVAHIARKVSAGESPSRADAKILGIPPEQSARAADRLRWFDENRSRLEQEIPNEPETPGNPVVPRQPLPPTTPGAPGASVSPPTAVPSVPPQLPAPVATTPTAGQPAGPAGPAVDRDALFAEGYGIAQKIAGKLVRSNKGIEADDLTQEASTALLEKIIPGYDQTKGQFANYASRAIRRTMLDWIKAAKRGQGVGGETPLPEAAVAGEAETIAEVADEQDARTRAMAALSERDRESLRAGDAIQAGEGTWEDAAKNWGLSVSGARKRYDAAFGRLKNAIEGWAWKPPVQASEAPEEAPTVESTPTPTPPGSPKPPARRRRKPPEKRDVAGNLRAYATQHELNVEDFLSAASDAFEGMKEGVSERRSIKLIAHKKTGLNALDVARVENTGFDYSSGRNIGGKTGEKLAHFDEFAQELASDFPHIFGQDPERALWDLLREPKIQDLQMDDPEVIAAAHEMLENANNYTDLMSDWDDGSFAEPTQEMTTSPPGSLFPEDSAINEAVAKREAAEEFEATRWKGEKSQKGKQGALFADLNWQREQQGLFDVNAPAAEQAQQAAEATRTPTEARGTTGGLPNTAERIRADEIPGSVKNPDPEVERRLSKARGLKRESLAAKIKQWSAMAWRAITRAQEHLPNTPKFAAANEFFRLLKNVGAAAQDEAIRTVAAIIDPLGPKQMHLFERREIAENQLAALAMGQPLRHGFKGQGQVEAYRDQLQTLVDQTPEVQQAIETRNRVVRELVQEAVSLDLLPTSTLENTEAYFHQQVHLYQQVDRRAASGGARAGRISRSFQRRRVTGEELGEELDYNTSYVEAEVSWMTDCLIEIRKERLLRKLAEQYDIKGELKQKAKAINFEKLVGGPQVVARIMELRGILKESYASEDRNESYERQRRAVAIEELQDIDPTYPYRVRMGMNAAILAKRLGMDEEAFEESYGEEPDWMAIVQEQANLGDPAALGIFKAMNEQRQMIQEALGKDYLTWESLAEKMDGYDIFQPEPGNVFYRAFTIPERIVESLMENMVESEELTKDDLRQVLAMGGPRRQFVMPAEVVDQLRATQKPKEVHGLARLADEAMRSWKVYTLLNPKRFFGYNLRNLTGDLDPVIAAFPKILKYIKRAIEELHKYHSGHLALSSELRKARDLGSVGSGFTAEEVPELKELPIFQRFFEASGKPKSLMKPLAAWYDIVKPYTQFREDVLRYAAFLAYLDELKSGRVSNFGGAKKQIVNELRKQMGVEVAAAHLSRNLLGDYGNITVAGSWIRKRLMPFWSFQEVNIKRVPRLFINAWEAGGAKGAAGTVVKLTPAAARAILMSRVFWMYAALYVWNNLIMGGDDEDDLPPYDRANPHINLGRNPDGSVRYFRNVGAMGDFLEWFGLNELSVLLRKYSRGQTDFSEIASEMMKAPLEKVVGSLRPEVEAFTGSVMGQTLFPEPFQPRTIRRGEALANPFGLVDEYKWLKGMTLGDGSRPRRYYFQRWLLGVADPRATALSEMYDLRTSYLKKKGTGAEGGVYPVSRYKEARDAAINEDYDAFRDWQRTFLKEEGPPARSFKKFKAFVQGIDPVSKRLTERDERDFEKNFLTTEQRQQLKVARDYSQSLQTLLLTWWKAGLQEDSGKLALQKMPRN